MGGSLCKPVPVFFWHVLTILWPDHFLNFLAKQDAPVLHRDLPCPISGISHFSKEPWFILTVSSVYKPRPSVRCAHCYWGVTRSHQWSEQGNINKCTHTLNPFLYLVLKAEFILLCLVTSQHYGFILTFLMSTSELFPSAVGNLVRIILNIFTSGKHRNLSQNCYPMSLWKTNTLARVQYLFPDLFVILSSEVL